MSFGLSLIIENGLYIAIFLVCAFGAYASFKHYKTLPGADLVSLGLLLYAAYALLATTGPGFNGSFFRDLLIVGKLSSETALFFLSLVLRLGLILVVIGLYRIGRGEKKA